MIQRFRGLLLVVVKWKSIGILEQYRNVIIITEVSFPSNCTNRAKYVVWFCFLETLKLK